MITRVVRRFNIRKLEFDYILQEKHIHPGGMDEEFMYNWYDIKVLTKLERSLL